MRAIDFLAQMKELSKLINKDIAKSSEGLFGQLGSDDPLSTLTELRWLIEVLNKAKLHCLEIIEEIEAEIEEGD